MIEFIKNGGSVMWLLLLLAILLLILIGKTIIEIFKRKDMIAAEYGLNSILFWGCISAAAGIFGHFSGIYVAMSDILAVKDVSPKIVTKGYMIAFSNIILGLLLFIIAVVLWMFLRWQYKKLLVKSSPTNI
ncbi:MotA/TolQ/ExbB proton channel family protein [candidate division KSB1 bacterium]|nr:MotA/TolQ/ExbB proton channel family protein [candidate division KSB1 bacterium]